MNLIIQAMATGQVGLLILVTVIAVISQLPGRRKRSLRPGRARKRVGFFTGAAAGAVFLIMSELYRPSLAFLAKAQIRQHEDADEDDAGGPKTPTRHLHRQLRRIRRGERLEAITLRCE
jgi:hypothetical protein